MKVSIFFRVPEDHPAYTEEPMEWVGELPEEGYRIYHKYKVEYKYAYEDIRDKYRVDEVFSDEEFEQGEILSLNFKILQEALPAWTLLAVQQIAEDLNSSSDEEQEPLTEDDLEITGCRFGNQGKKNPVSDWEYDPDGEMIPFTLHYYIDYGGGDYGNEMEWNAMLPKPIYEKYTDYVQEHPEAEESFATFELLFPEWVESEYDKIIDYETDFFLENEDPDDWGFGEETDEAGWKITDSCVIRIKDFSIDL